MGRFLSWLLLAACRHAGKLSEMRANWDELRQGRDQWRSGTKRILTHQPLRYSPFRSCAAGPAYLPSLFRSLGFNSTSRKMTSL